MTEPPIATRIAERILKTRWLMRLPIPLYRAGFGWMLGERFVMIETLGRVSRERRFVVVEVVRRGRNEVCVASGFGPKAQWYRNLKTNGIAYLSTGRARRVPAAAELLDDAGSAAVLRDYAQQYPEAWEMLSSVMTELSGSAVVPVVRFTPPDVTGDRSSGSEPDASAE
ncbi:MAG TPA: nitroreductase family deazaflavin-dependent oxidoreductase [Microbacterium sp.]|nr:nitroreductase family deazaflavin-dependent oxidoreductase [Microbacterium sp.]